MPRFGRFLPLPVLLLLGACAANPADEKLEEAVRASIRQYPELVADTLRVRCENGVVYVSGLVPTYREYVEVEQVVRAAPGVSKVVNMTTIDNRY